MRRIVHVAFLADGVNSRDDDQTDHSQELETRRVSAQKACGIIGVESVSFDEMPDNRMDTVAMLDIVKVVESLIAKFQKNFID